MSRLWTLHNFQTALSLPPPVPIKQEYTFSDKPTKIEQPESSINLFNDSQHIAMHSHSESEAQRLYEEMTRKISKQKLQQPDSGSSPLPEESHDESSIEGIQSESSQESQDPKDGFDEACEDKKKAKAKRQKRKAKRKAIAKQKKIIRKIRTTITQDKLVQMNSLFAQFQRKKDQGQVPDFNIKQISSLLNLGYSTVLHKFRQFRQTKTIKPSVLVNCKYKKRKYNKSLIIEEYISNALKVMPFYTAIELSSYIQKVYHVKLSRSIISRHLGVMGYSYRSPKPRPSNPVYRQIRAVYADIVLPYLQRPDSVILYIDELTCHVNRSRAQQNHKYPPKDLINFDAEKDYVSAVVGATIDGICCYQAKEGLINQNDYLQLLRQCLDLLSDRHRGSDCTFIVITDIHQIHWDYKNAIYKPVTALHAEYQARHFYLPPRTPTFNPLENIFSNLKNKLKKFHLTRPYEVQRQMEIYFEEIKWHSMEETFDDVRSEIERAKDNLNVSMGTSFGSLDASGLSVNDIYVKTNMSIDISESKDNAIPEPKSQVIMSESKEEHHKLKSEEIYEVHNITSEPKVEQFDFGYDCYEPNAYKESEIYYSDEEE